MSDPELKLMIPRDGKWYEFTWRGNSSGYVGGVLFPSGNDWPSGQVIKEEGKEDEGTTGSAVHPPVGAR